ncbi:MAG: hypothetical protein ACLTYN_09520 [Dysosmobacter welbionis]
MGLNLAYTGAVKDEILDMETLGCHLMAYLGTNYPEALRTGYKLPSLPERQDGEEDVAWGYRLLEAVGKKRGFLISGGEVDTERMAKILLDEYRAGKLGRFTRKCRRRRNSLQRQNEGSAPMNCPSCGKRWSGEPYTELGRGLFFLPPGGKVDSGIRSAVWNSTAGLFWMARIIYGERPRNCTWLCLPRLQKILLEY